MVAKPKAMQKTSELETLNALQMLLIPIAMMVAHGERRAILETRVQLTRYERKRRKELKVALNELAAQAKIFEALLVGCWTRLGEYYAYRWRTSSEAGSPRRKIQRVKFRKIRYNMDRTLFEIMIHKRNILGKYRDALPHRVLVQDLVSETTRLELQASLRRKVTVVNDKVEHGVWVIVHHNEVTDGLPVMVRFEDAIPLFPVEHIAECPVLLGIGEDRQPHVVYLSEHPHMLVAGASGTGKSNFVHNFITSTMYLTDPDDLKFILVDLKNGVEFFKYRNTPHMHRDVIMDPYEALDMLQIMRREIHTRTTRIRGLARELSVWNERFPSEKMPRIIIVIDEFAELMQGRGKKIHDEAADLVSSMARLGRSVGIHLVVATQYPIREVLPSQVKSNMDIRVAFKLQTKTQSAVVINTGEAAGLPEKIKGRLVYLVGAVPKEAQAVRVTDDDIDRVIAVAWGKAHKLIRLEGIVPVIETENLTHHIYNVYNGSLSFSRLSEELRDYAITPQMLRTFLDDLIARGTRGVITVRGAEYTVEVGKGKKYRLRRVGGNSEPVRERPMLLLPPPRPPEPEPQPEPEPEDPEAKKKREALETLRAIRAARKQSSQPEQPEQAKESAS
jgi:hypothetical protein